MAYVFLSHSHQDKPFARRIAADLRNAGHSVWLDEAEINIGDSLVEKITFGLREVDFVAAILSRGSIDSPWVARELDIASNREMQEGRVVVLPLLLDDVQLPGFLEGKLYGDFRADANYQSAFAQVLRALGNVAPTPPADKSEVELLQVELEAVRAMAAREAEGARRAEKAAYQGKSDELKAAIEEANTKFPSHAPINRTYAFQMDHSIVTLDYALWAIQKSIRKGAHPLEGLLSVYDRWSDLENMMDAYNEMAARQR